MRKISKLLAIILSLAIICAALPLGAVTVSAEKEGYYTCSVSDGQATITDCSTSISGKVTIPSTLGGYPVTSIGDWAFSHCDGLTSITIPNSVTNIGSYAFSDCTGLTSVTIPKSVTSIGDGTFDGCTGLTSVTIPDSVTSIDWYAFRGCTGLESIAVDINNPTYHSAGNCLIETASKILICGCNNSIIPSDGSVTSIGYGAFSDCASLTSVTIPNSVTSIDNWAFSGCTGLKSITIPNRITNIGYCAFYDCSGLTSVTIPNSVTYIDAFAFEGCTGLTSVTIPKSITSIGRYTFYKCDGLKRVIYCGTEEQWNAITIETGNDSLTSANRYYHTDHIFDSDCDATCNICGYVRKVTPHVFVNGVCIICGIPEYTPGDLDGNDVITDADAVYLLMYTFFPDDYPINQNCDFDGNGAITDADAVYLLMYTFFPDDYPIIKEQQQEPDEPVQNVTLPTLYVTKSSTGEKVSGNALTILEQVVEAEIGATYQAEALKAQAVAAYGWMLTNGAADGKSYPTVPMKPPSARCKQAVAEVAGIVPIYNGKVAQTFYFDTSAGRTANYEDIWGGGVYAYLKSVDSSVDKNSKAYPSSATYKASDIAAWVKKTYKNRIIDLRNVDLMSITDRTKWFTPTYDANGVYVKNIKVGDVTIRGSYLRSYVLNSANCGSGKGLRSPAYKITYNKSDDTFTFTVYGYGHGVGMSQTGADLYAKAGWTYKQILTHYFTGISFGTYS